MSNNNTIKKVLIKDTEYCYELLDAFTAFTVSAQLLEIFAPVIGVWIDDKANKEGGFSFDESTFFTEIALQLSRSLGSLNVADLIKTLAGDIYKNNSKVDFGEEFRGNFSGAMLLIEDIFLSNFGEHFLEYLRAKGLEVPTWEELKSHTKKEETTEKS